MHTVTLTQPIENSRWALQPGSYLMEDLSAFELAIDADRGTAIVRPWERYNPNVASSTLLISNGGFGDMMLWGPALRKHRARFPFHNLMLATRSRTHCVFDGLGYAPTLLDYPVPLPAVHDSTRVLTSEHVQENQSDDAKNIPAIDLKARILGVDPLAGDERKVEYNLTSTERLFAETKYPRNHRRRVGIQLLASSPTRTYHRTRMSELMTLLYEENIEMYLLGSPGSVPADAIPEAKKDLIKNLCANRDLTFRESVAIAATCDCLLTPDSSFVHVAGALGLPCVALFASTHWKTRTADYPTVIAIQSNIACDKAPCFHHPRGHHIWVKDAICAKEGHCTPLNSIPPDRIVAKIEKQISTYGQKQPAP